MKKKYLVALSGGIDSAVTAAILMKEGHEVVGVTMSTGIGDPSGAAAEVAQDLGIKHYVLDLEKEFRQEVIDYFISEYSSGETPNPCVVCNKKLKFAAFFPLFNELQADYFATGHYVRQKLLNGRHLLYRAGFLPKDQSYVLYTLTQEVLAKTAFPLGEYSKDEVRQIAKELGLKAAAKKESQDICFIPDGDYRSYLSRACPASLTAGDIIDGEGHWLGRHQGLAYYTVGQRKGLGLALGYPAYVIALDEKKNRLIIGREEELYCSLARTKNNNFLPFDSLGEIMKVSVKVRYKSEPVTAEIAPLNDGQVQIRFLKPERAVTPGQSAVFYQDDLLIGGGVICRTE